MGRKNDIETYSKHNDGKSVVAEGFIGILTIKIYKYTPMSKNMYINKLDVLVNKYNNTYHNTITMKPADAKSGLYIDFNENNNKEAPKADHHVRISKYKNIFGKGYVSNWN